MTQVKFTSFQFENESPDLLNSQIKMAKTRETCVEGMALRSTPKLVQMKELSSILGRSESSLRYHLRMGRIKATAKFGRSYSFDPQEVLKQLKRAVDKP